MSGKTPAETVRELQQRVDDEGLRWFVSHTGHYREDEPHFTAHRQNSNQVVIHTDPETLLTLLRAADSRLNALDSPVQVTGGVMSSESLKTK